MSDTEDPAVKKRLFLKPYFIALCDAAIVTEPGGIATTIPNITAEKRNSINIDALLVKPEISIQDYFSSYIFSGRV
jgi:hypothetical protein